MSKALKKGKNGSSASGGVRFPMHQCLKNIQTENKEGK